MSSRLAVFCLAGALAACGGVPGLPAEELPSRWEPLSASREMLSLGARDGKGQFGSRRMLHDEAPSPVPLALRRGHLVVRVDGESVSLEAADVWLEDIVLTPEQLPPDGIRLVQQRARLASPVSARADWKEPGVIDVELKVDLRVDGSLQTADGDISPLDTLWMRVVPARLELREAPSGAVHARASASRPGVFWSWAGLIEFSDLQFQLSAVDDSEGRPN